MHCSHTARVLGCSVGHRCEWITPQSMLDLLVMYGPYEAVRPTTTAGPATTPRMVTTTPAAPRGPRRYPAVLWSPLVRVVDISFDVRLLGGKSRPRPICRTTTAGPAAPPRMDTTTPIAPGVPHRCPWLPSRPLVRVVHLSFDVRVLDDETRPRPLCRRTTSGPAPLARRVRRTPEASCVPRRHPLVRVSPLVSVVVTSFEVQAAFRP
jgi:hypothetical protein